MKETKTIKVECRTWSMLQDRKIRKPNGDWETFAEVVQRLLEEYENDEKKCSITRVAPSQSNIGLDGRKIREDNK